MRLIKTAIEFTRTDPNHQNILLGSWCLKNSKDILRINKDYNIHTYHWDDRRKYNDDYVSLSEIYEETLIYLVSTLNSIHNIDRDLRYWRIVIGPWLRFYIDALFDRYECIRTVKENNLDLNSELLTYDISDWCPADFSGFWFDLTSEEWNEVILSECIKYQKIPYKNSNDFLVAEDIGKRKNTSLSDKYKNILKWFSSKYSEAVGKKYKGTLIIGAYISLRKLLKLYLGLLQLPLLSLPILKLKSSELNQAMRQSLRNSEKNKTGFKGFADKLLPVFMPKIYLEDFSEMRIKILAKLPNKPKSIYTANLYQSDDIFKIWAAECVSIGVPLIVGQHGGNFSIGRYDQTVDHQFLIADKFVSWGWDNNTEDHIYKLPSMQLSNRIDIASDIKGNILHVMTSLPRYFYCHYSIPVSGQFLSYINNQLEFFDLLEPAVIDKLNIRLDPTKTSRGWDIQGMINNAGYSSKVDITGCALLEAIKASRVCVCSSNTTVFLETLAMNFPTIIFWDPNYNEISIDAQPYIDLLIEANLLFYSPEEAAEKVNEVADNIHNWWFSEEVQYARKRFCERYAMSSTDWVDHWVRFLK